MLGMLQGIRPRPYPPEGCTPAIDYQQKYMYVCVCMHTRVYVLVVVLNHSVLGFIFIYYAQWRLTQSFRLLWRKQIVGG